jgi:hypothetical protein
MRFEPGERLPGNCHSLFPKDANTLLAKRTF